MKPVGWEPSLVTLILGTVPAGQDTSLSWGRVSTDAPVSQPPGDCPQLGADRACASRR